VGVVVITGTGAGEVSTGDRVGDGVTTTGTGAGGDTVVAGGEVGAKSGPVVVTVVLG
jgi:hypothetical protein